MRDARWHHGQMAMGHGPVVPDLTDAQRERLLFGELGLLNGRRAVASVHQALAEVSA